MNALAPALWLALALPAQAPQYRYEQAVPQPPGTILYAHWRLDMDISVASSRAAYHEMRKAGRAGDTIGLVEMEDAGHIFGLKVGTAILVLGHEGTEATDLVYEVRVRDGKHRDRKAWIPMALAKRRVVVEDGHGPMLSRLKSPKR
jgi:hypothetical protein